MWDLFGVLKKMGWIVLKMLRKHDSHGFSCLLIVNDLMMMFALARRNRTIIIL